MYTNIFRKFKTGGSVDASARNKASEIVSKASKNSKIPVEKLLNKLKSFSSDTEKQKFANLLVAASSDEESTEKNNAIKELQKKCNSVFENGGKMQAFICKHGHGGVNCGCGGGKVVRGAEGMETPGNPYEGWTILPRQWKNNSDGSTQAIQVVVSPDGNTGYQRIITDRSQMGNRNGMAVRDTVYGGGAYGNGKVWVDASQNLTKQEKAALDEYLDGKVKSNQNGGTVFDTVNAWFNNNPNAAQRDTVGFKDYVRGYKGPGEAEDTIVETLPNGWQRRHRREWQGFGNAPEHRDTVVVSPSGVVYQPEVVNPDTEKIESNEFGGVVMGKDGLSRKQVRADKRAVKKLMGSHNGHTAEERYQSMIDASRNYDQYAGMSRLERKNAINQYLLGNIKPNNGIGPISEVTDVEPGQSPNLSGYYESNNTSSYNRGYNNPEITFAYDKPAPIVIENQDQISPTSRLNDPDYVRRSTEAQWMLQRGIPIEELRKNPKYADVLEDPDEMRFGGRIKTSNINGSLIKNYKLNK